MDYFSKKRVLFWIIISFLVINIISLGGIWYVHLNKDAHFDRRMMGFRPPHRMERILGLSEDQKQKFRESKQKHQELSQPIHEKINGLKKELMGEIFKDDYNSEKTDVLRQELVTQFSQFEKLTHDHFKELKTFCTKEQELKLKQFLIGLVDFMGPHRGKRRHGMMFGSGRFKKSPHSSFWKQTEKESPSFSADEE